LFYYRGEARTSLANQNEVYRASQKSFK